MSQRRVAFYTPEELRMWATTSTMDIINNVTGRRVLRSFIFRNYGNVNLQILDYLRCYEICFEMRNSSTNPIDRLTDLFDTLPDPRWERRILLSIDLYDGHHLRTEIMMILREIQDELWQLIEQQPEFRAFRDEITGSNQNNGN